MAGIDLGALDTAALCDKGAELELLHPVTGEPLGARITLAGVDSRLWRRAVAAVADRRGKRGQRPTAESARADGIEILARCTLGWSGMTLDGKELPCTEENARLVYGRFPWLREQVDAFCSDRASYLRD